MADDKFFGEAQAAVEGKIVCECGNNDWKQFLFAGIPPTSIIGGCKRCGRTYANTPDGWVNKSGPAPGRD